MVNIPPLQIEKVLNLQKQKSQEEGDLFDLNTDFEVMNDDTPLGLSKVGPLDISPGEPLPKKMYKSPSLVIETNLNGYDDDLDDGRMPTEVHYESDSGEIHDVKVDLINDSLSDSKRNRRGRRNEGRGLGISKQGSGQTL